MARRQKTIAFWLRNVIAWDGFLPVCVALFPIVLGLLMPGVPDALAVAAVVVPIVALIIRFHVGKRHIESNSCGTAFRALQYIVFAIGILLLTCIESILIAVGLNALLPNDQDKNITGVLVIVYLVAMAIAMYPGQMDIARIAAEEGRTMDEGPIVPS